MVFTDTSISAQPAVTTKPLDRRITVQLVLKVVARRYNVTVQQLLVPTRRQPTCRQRQIAMFLACELTPNSLPDIGQRFGGKDHTTIMHGRNRITDLLNTDPELEAEIEALKKGIRQEP